VLKIFNLLLLASWPGGCARNEPVPEIQPAILAPLSSATASKWITLDLGHQVALHVAAIAAGGFKVGDRADRSEYQRSVAPNHGVTLTAEFALGVDEVTVEQFAVFVQETQYQTDAEKQGFAYGYVGGVFRRHDGYTWRRTGFKQAGSHPVVNVSWNDAKAFCTWLGKRSGKSVRLPTEAEWEYACRAGATTEYPWGNDLARSKEFANVFEQSALREFPESLREPPPEGMPSWDDGYVYTAPVGQFRPNAFGLHDMIGNCAEWCEDYYGPYTPGPNKDPKGPVSGTDRVIRGGSWKDLIQYCRTASRSYGAPEDACDWIGFRVCVELSR
jgi:formylglycine-generating enzyme required for sulfatase activity